MMDNIDPEKYSLQKCTGIKRQPTPVKGMDRLEVSFIADDVEHIDGRVVIFRQGDLLDIYSMDNALQNILILCLMAYPDFFKGERNE